ncbi:MAG: hypothetical protein ACE5I1_30850 [bacterium]
MIGKLPAGHSVRPVGLILLFFEITFILPQRNHLPHLALALTCLQARERHPTAQPTQIDCNLVPPCGFLLVNKARHTLTPDKNLPATLIQPAQGELTWMVAAAAIS